LPICGLDIAAETPSHSKSLAGSKTMKMVAEYLEKALSFEQMAAAETDPKLKADLLEQAKAYRKLAADRASKEPLTPLRESN
jgi:hypothetical protein